MTSQRGMSLVEATIILLVLSILTAVLTPSLLDYVDDARQVKAKEDVEAIGLAIVRLLKDTGFPFLVEDATLPISTRYNMANRADLAVSSGNIPSVQDGVDAGISSPPPPAAFQTISWTDAVNESAGKVYLYNQLVSNAAGYPSPTAAMGTAIPAAPAALGRFGMGWRGAYLSGVVGPDPWGYRYTCATLFLGAAVDATPSADALQGSASAGWQEDAVCLSAGSNNAIETDFDQATWTPYTSRGSIHFAGTQNDDVLYVLSGYGR